MAGDRRGRHRCRGRRRSSLPPGGQRVSCSACRRETAQGLARAVEQAVPIQPRYGRSRGAASAGLSAIRAAGCGRASSFRLGHRLPLPRSGRRTGAVARYQRTGTNDPYAEGIRRCGWPPRRWGMTGVRGQIHGEPRRDTARAPLSETSSEHGSLHGSGEYRKFRENYLSLTRPSLCFMIVELYTMGNDRYGSAADLQTHPFHPRLTPAKPDPYPPTRHLAAAGPRPD